MRCQITTQPRGITDRGWDDVKDAEKKIRDELARTCVCHAQGPDSCIPCEYTVPLLNALDTSTIMASMRADICGQVQAGGRVIEITSAGFNSPGCGCLALTIYHELLHAIGLRHTAPPDRVTELDKQCKANLCKP